MPKSFSTETVQRAERLYCIDGYSFSEIRDMTGVSLRQLKYWGRKWEWTEKRHENRRILLNIEMKKNRLREILLDKCLEKVGTRDVLALVALESLTRKASLNEARRQVSLPREPQGGPTTIQDGIEALETAGISKMKQLAADPEQLDLQTIRGIEEAIRLAEHYRNRLKCGGFMMDLLREKGSHPQGKTAREEEKSLVKCGLG